MGLKELRQHRQLTQQALAEMLGTTQQTIARWESGKNAIPSTYLQKVASSLGVGVEQLLGANADKDKQETRDESFAVKQYKEPFGTLRVQLRFGVREYPISVVQRDKVMKNLHQLDKDWLAFTALDNRIVLINPVYIRSLDLITDDFEQMPLYASPEAYKVLTDADPADPANAITTADPQFRQEIDQAIKLLPDEVPDPDDVMQSGADKISLAMHYTRVLWPNGSVSQWPMFEDDVDWIDIIEDMGPREFREIHSDGVGIHRFINAIEAAVVEAPLQLYLDLKAKAETGA
jgi:transcriptional regulator with XRE-family HTH domain